MSVVATMNEMTEEREMCFNNEEGRSVSDGPEKKT